MDKDFKCRSCGLVFRANDDMEVACPSCNSDNLDLFKPKNGKSKVWLWSGLVFIIAIGAGIGISFLAHPKSEREEIEEEEINEAFQSTEEMPVKIVGEPIREVSLTYNDDLKGDPTSKTYSFSYRSNNVPENATQKFELYDFETGQLKMTSSDGKFTKVPPATDAIGSYRVVLKAQSGDQELTNSHVVTGLIKFPDATLPKLSVSQMQTLINQMIAKNNSSVLSTNPQISGKVSFKYQGLHGDDVAPTSFSKLLQQVQMDIWSGMKVISLGYDENTNQVNQMVIQPIYSE